MLRRSCSSAAFSCAYHSGLKLVGTARAGGAAGRAIVRSRSGVIATLPVSKLPLRSSATRRCAGARLTRARGCSIDSRLPGHGPFGHALLRREAEAAAQRSRQSKNDEAPDRAHSPPNTNSVVGSVAIVHFVAVCGKHAAHAWLTLQVSARPASARRARGGPSAGLCQFRISIVRSASLSADATVAAPGTSTVGANPARSIC